MDFRRSVCFISLLTAAALAGSLTYAAERPKLYASLDYFLPGNIEDSLDDLQIENTDTVLSEDGDPKNSKESSGAFGGRIGALLPVPRFSGYWIGGSLGYVKGPKTKLTTNDVAPPPGALVSEFEQEYIRALVELAHIADLNQQLAFKFGVGVGLGKGTTKQKHRFDGYYADLFENSESSRSSTKLTWEISPALVIKGGRFDVEIGARYAQFPEIKENTEIYKVDYSGFGFYTGIGF